MLLQYIYQLIFWVKHERFSSCHDWDFRKRPSDFRGFPTTFRRLPKIFRRPMNTSEAQHIHQKTLKVLGCLSLYLGWSVCGGLDGGACEMECTCCWIAWSKLLPSYCPGWRGWSDWGCSHSCTLIRALFWTLSMSSWRYLGNAWWKTGKQYSRMDLTHVQWKVTISLGGISALQSKIRKKHSFVCFLNDLFNMSIRQHFGRGSPHHKV